MTNCSRLAAFGAVLATLAVATPAFAASIAATPKATARAQIVSPLQLTRKADLNFGTIVLGTLTASSTVTVGKLAGDKAVCGANLSCSGASQPAVYNVRSTPNQVLVIRAAASTLALVGGLTTDTIDFKPDAPTTVTVPIASTSGADFIVGGEIAVPTTVKEGVYLGDMDVTVDYN
jgi:hypothetical protein